MQKTKMFEQLFNLLHIHCDFDGQNYIANVDQQICHTNNSGASLSVKMYCRETELVVLMFG